VYVVNAYSREFAGLSVTAKLYNLDMTEKGSQTATVKVAADGKAKALTIAWPPGLTTCHFLRLLLEGEGGRRLSDNFYWLSTAPDEPSPLDAQFANPLSTADYKDLNALPAIPLNVASHIEEQGAERLAQVTVENPSKHLAFFVHLAVKQGEQGAEIAPTFWDDNYFSVLPGEKKAVNARFAAADLEGAAPVITLDGWNVAR
jgi:exo-1,4-beta-D-glucosaminidase